MTAERPTPEELAARVREGIESDSGEYGLQDDALAALSELTARAEAAEAALELGGWRKAEGYWTKDEPGSAP